MRDKSESVVLDASAIIALIYEEKGSELVEACLQNAVVSTVNLTEVASYLIKKDYSSKETMNIIRDLVLTVENYDAAQAFLAAELIQKTASKGLSLGDRACLALAILKELPILTADRIWIELDLPVRIDTIR